MLTNQDIKKLKTIFVTKQDLEKTNQALVENTQIILEYIDVRLKPLERFERIADEVENKIVQFKDEILGEIVAMRQELAVTLGHRDILANHETRITKLEKKASKSN